MNCIRCEIARAKLWAILYHNTGRSAADLVNKLNETQDGVYYRHCNLSFGIMETVYRKSNVEGAPPIEIWVF